MDRPQSGPESLLLINASPRAKSTSFMLLKRIQSKLGGEILQIRREDPDLISKRIAQGSTIVIAGPCYINSWPSGVIKLMEHAAKLAPYRGQKLYGIINGGMPYIHTHRSGVDSLQIFADECGLSWMGGFVLGGGAMLDGQPLEKHISAGKIVPAFDRFVEQIAKGEASPDCLYQEAQPAPGWLFTQVTSKMLTLMVTRQLKKHGHHPDDKGPYMNAEDAGNQ